MHTDGGAKNPLIFVMTNYPKTRPFLINYFANWVPLGASILLIWGGLSQADGGGKVIDGKVIDPTIIPTAGFIVISF